VNPALLADIGIAASCLGFTVYTVAYGLTRPWWRSATGVQLFTCGAVLAVLCGIRLYARTIGPVSEWTFAIGFPVLAVTAWGFVWLLARARRNGAGRPERAEE
jgi:hypothetical protein